MAKKTPAQAAIPADDVVGSILKDFGEGVLISGDDLLDRDKTLIPVSPALDFGHNGGWQEGTFVVLSGPPRCGKTTTSLHFAGKCQRPEHGSRQVIYLNAEARLEKRDLHGIASIRTDKASFMIAQSTPPAVDSSGAIVKPGKILTAKDYLGIAERFLLNTVGKVVILDSVSAMMGESEWNEGLDSVAIGEAQRLFSTFMRRMSQVIATNRHIFIGIVHLYSNIGNSMGPKWLEKMSTSANYGLATKLRATHFEPWTTGDKVVIGQVVHWRCERSPLGQPGIVADSFIRYGEGIDEVQEIIKYALYLKFIVRDGSWYKLEFAGGAKKKKPNLHGEEALRDYLVSHADELSLLRNKVYDGLGLACATPPGT
jgi:recombination protein RecA